MGNKSAPTWEFFELKPVFGLFMLEEGLRKKYFFDDFF